MCWLLGTKRGHVLKLPQTYHFQFHSSSTGSLSWNWNWNFHALHLSNSLRRQHPYSDISWKSGIIQCKYELKLNINIRPNTKVGVSINPIWTRHNRTFLFAVWSPNPSLPKMVKGNSIVAFFWAGLHKLWYPGIRDRSTWGKFGAHGEHGDVFLFSNLGALWFSENLIRYSLHVCLREVKNNLFSFKHSYLRHFSWRF